jgi:hypothetical protein
MRTRRAFAAAILLLSVLLAPPSGAKDPPPADWHNLGRRKTDCFETECIINPAGVHRFLKPLGDSQFKVVPDRGARGDAAPFHPPPARLEPADSVRERLGRERPFGIEGTPPRGVLRGGSPVIPRR